MKMMYALFAVLFFLSFQLKSQAQLKGLKDKFKGGASASPATAAKNAMGEAEVIQAEKNKKLEDCEKQAGGRIKPTEDKYPSFKEKGVSVFSQFGVWFLRKDLEAARFYLTNGKEGYGSDRGIRCDADLLKNTDGYKALWDRFNAAEKQLEEMEKAKGVKFMGCKDNSILYNDIKTNKPVANPDQV